MTRSATARVTRPNTPVESVRADEVRVTDRVWFQSWDNTWKRGQVNSISWDGEDVEVFFVDVVTNSDVRISTSPGNGVFVSMR